MHRLAARAANKNRDVPARLRYLALPKGKREKKFEALAKLSLAGLGWIDGATGWREPFLPEQTGAWATFPPLAEFFWSGSGVKTHRTWVIAPDVQLWKTLEGASREKDPDKKGIALSSGPGCRQSQRALRQQDDDRGVGGHHRNEAVSVEVIRSAVVSPFRYAFRSFDRQWIMPDHRLLSRARPDLW